jgi:hypothetical protein
MAAAAAAAAATAAAAAAAACCPVKHAAAAPPLPTPPARCGPALRAPPRAAARPAPARAARCVRRPAAASARARRAGRRAVRRQAARARLALPLQGALLLLQLLLFALERAQPRRVLVVVGQRGVVLVRHRRAQRERNGGRARRSRWRSLHARGGVRRARRGQRAGRPRRRPGERGARRRPVHRHGLARCWLQLRSEAAAPARLGRVRRRLRRVLGGGQVAVQPEHRVSGVQTRHAAVARRSRSARELPRCHDATLPARTRAAGRRGARHAGGSRARAAGEGARWAGRRRGEAVLLPPACMCCWPACVRVRGCLGALPPPPCVSPHARRGLRRDARAAGAAHVVVCRAAR